MSKWQWLLRQLGSTLWVRALLFCLAGITAALIGYLVKDIVPTSLARSFGAEALDTVLTIIASSMLAVTTFSLNILVSAFSSAANGATPRAFRLLQDDHTSQNAVSTFIGAFLFSLVGLIALKTGLYGNGGRVVLLAVTLIMVVIVIGVMLRWIHHLTQFGRLGDTIRRIEAATAEAIAERIRNPYLGGRPYPATGPSQNDHPVTHDRIGYVMNIDAERLQELAERLDCPLLLAALPGSFNDSVKPLLHVGRAISEDDAASIRSAFTIGDERNLTLDPRFGCVMLGEIASRALSPAVNDPGTAIDIVNTSVRLLAPWVRAEAAPADLDIVHSRLHVPPLATAELLDDVFTPIARDGASLIEVQIALQKAYAALSSISGGACSEVLANLAEDTRARAMMAMTSEADRRRLSRHAFTA